MKELFIDSNGMDWVQARGYPSGTQGKVLRKENGTNTILLKLAQGFHMDAHCHTTTEQHFVLEGEYTGEGKTYGVGSYRLIPAGVTHGPFSSEKGALVLVIWDPE
jgi:anti-sigma factor ChrR (cupin superfamily)